MTKNFKCKSISYRANLDKNSFEGRLIYVGRSFSDLKKKSKRSSRIKDPNSSDYNDILNYILSDEYNGKGNLEFLTIDSTFSCENYWILDAEPQVVDLFNKIFSRSSLFPVSSSFVFSMAFSKEGQKGFSKIFDLEESKSEKTEDGSEEVSINKFNTLQGRVVERAFCQYTHRPRKITDSIETRKDLLWFSSRFKIHIEECDLELLKTGSKSYDDIKENTVTVIKTHTPLNIPLALPLREYQETAVALLKQKLENSIKIYGEENTGLLIADQVGLGKTPTAIGCVAEPHLRPALVVCPTHLCNQWEHEIKKFLPNSRVKILKGVKNIKDPGDADFYITTYSRLSAWADVFGTGDRERLINSIIFDEVHELRREETRKYDAALYLTSIAKVKVGLSATPIMNYGNDIFNVMRILDPSILGNYSDFTREWTYVGQIRDPRLLGNFLRKNHAMIRRTRDDVKRYLSQVNKIMYTIDADLETLRAVEEESRQLAIKILTGNFKESGQAARELDYILRQATGVAKAAGVAEMVRVIVESGEKVVLFGWHKKVYEIWGERLSDLNPVFYTGSESPIEKEDSLKRFREDDSCKVFIISLRSGSGLNGLQDVSSYCVFGELDWSPGIMEQCIGRLWREGQKNMVTAMYITVADGSDPVIMGVLGLKKSEAAQIIDPTSKEIGESFANDKSRIQSLVESILKKEVDMPDLDISKKEEVGKKKEAEDLIIEHIRKTQFPVNIEAEAQEKMHKLLKKVSLLRDSLIADKIIEREYVIDSKNRIDFCISDHGEIKNPMSMIGVEMKVSGASRADSLRQIKRYAHTGLFKSIILACPWAGLEPFDVKIDLQGKEYSVKVYPVNIGENAGI